MNQDIMRIGEVAAAAGVNIQTLRYYERRGLLPKPERNAGGQREYAEGTVRIIRFIKRSQDLGFTLSEVEELLRLRSQDGRSRTSVRRLAAAKALDIEGKLRHLQRMRKALNVLVDSCDCAEGQLQCPILEALDERPQRKVNHHAS